MESITGKQAKSCGKGVTNMEGSFFTFFFLRGGARLTGPHSAGPTIKLIFWISTTKLELLILVYFSKIKLELGFILFLTVLAGLFQF